MDKSLQWLTRNAVTVVCTCAGVFLGLCLAAPLLGWKLPDTVANLMGGALGAIASVAGALLVLKRQMMYADERRAAVQLGLLRKLAHFFRPFFGRFKYTFEEVDGNGNTIPLTEFGRRAGILDDWLKELIDDLRGDSHLWATLDSENVGHLQIAILSLELLSSAVIDLRQGASTALLHAVPSDFVGVRANTIQQYNELVTHLSECANDPEILSNRLSEEPSGRSLVVMGPNG